MKKNKNSIIFRNTIKAIIKYIKTSPILYGVFYKPTKNRKYNVEDLIFTVLKFIKLGITFRDSPLLFINIDISWTTIYKFYKKLIRYNIICDIYDDIVSKYMEKNNNKIKKHLQIFLSDTTLIQNKMGSEKVGYNPQLLKHKTSKISYITTKKGIPINVLITSGSNNDSKILFDQLSINNINFNKNNKNILLCDKGYDSDKIRKLLKTNNFGKLLCPHNKRNTKDKNKLKKLKLTSKDKNKLKKRTVIEHTFSHLKNFKRVSYRYDRLYNTFNTTVHLASLMIFFKKSSRNNSY